MKTMLKLLLVGLVGCAGCATTPEAITDCRVTLAPNLGGRAYVRDIRISRHGTQQATLQASVVNVSSGILRLDYKVDWLDAAGALIPSVASYWQSWSLAPMEVGSLSATAPSADAVDFRFYVKETSK